MQLGQKGAAETSPCLHEPCHSWWQTLPCLALWGLSWDRLWKQCHKTKQYHHHSFCLSSLFSSRMEMGGLWVYMPFLHTIGHFMYYIAVCTIALTISKYPHMRGALRSCSQHGEEKSSKLGKVSYRILWIENYECQIIPGGLKFLRCAMCKKTCQKNQSSFTWSSSWLICSINRVCYTDPQGAGGAKCFWNPPAVSFWKVVFM